MLVEIVGYAASALVALSLVMVSVLRLRIINLAGALLFVVYGIWISSIPILLTNGFITLVNIYHITRILTTKPSSFRYLKATPQRRDDIRAFIDLYKDDIVKFYPEFAVGPVEDALEEAGTVYLAMHNLRLEGLAYILEVDRAETELSGAAAELLNEARGRPHTGKLYYLGFDYITARYRDLGLAQNLYERLERTIPHHTVVCVIERSARRTRRFLHSNKFTEVSERGGLALLARTFAA
jgi:hypothetical protein